MWINGFQLDEVSHGRQQNLQKGHYHQTTQNVATEVELRSLRLLVAFQEQPDNEDAESGHGRQRQHRLPPWPCPDQQEQGAEKGEQPVIQQGGQGVITQPNFMPSLEVGGPDTGSALQRAEEVND